MNHRYWQLDVGYSKFGNNPCITRPPEALPSAVLCLYMTVRPLGLRHGARLPAHLHEKEP